MAEHVCPVCQGTGLTRSGSLDCSYNGCTVAAERAAFNERLRTELGVAGPWMLLEVAWAVRKMVQNDEREARHA